MRLETLNARAPLASAVYEGQVRHRRLAPRPHAFQYRIAQLYLDLDELAQVFERRWLWSSEHRNVAQFRRADFLGPTELPLSEAVRRRIGAATGQRPPGPIRLLAQLRYFGYVFNPVGFHYCFAPDGANLTCLVAEITNTPWKERHTYVLPVESALRHGGAGAGTTGIRCHALPEAPASDRCIARPRAVALSADDVKDGS
jgi:hypothetical protein